MKKELLAGYGALVFGLLLASAPAHAFPSLNLTPGSPDIESASITVDYLGNNAGGSLTASGIANVLTPPGSPGGNIAGGSFNINANINFNAQTASGTLSIGGTIAGLGFNSGTLLTGTFSSTLASQTFGAGPGDPLEFLFTVTGGDAAALYGGVGSTAGVILSQSGYTGSFAGNFSSAPFGALADTFQSQPGPGIAFPSLNLTPGSPEIESEFLNVDYLGNNAGGSLTASGFANVLTPPGSPGGNIVGGSFDINANINFNAQTASGTLSIGGTIAGLGFNSGTLLTGTFNSALASQTFGAGPGDPLEFLFTVTGGDAAALYGGVGSTAGVILSQSGYTGSFAGNFSSAPFGALADTFQSQPGPAPSIGGEVTGVVVRTIDCNNKTTKQKVRIVVTGSTATWDCEAAGLIVSPGDKIDMKIKGNAN